MPDGSSRSWKLENFLKSFKVKVKVLHQLQGFKYSCKTCTEPAAGMVNSFGHASFMELSPAVHHAVSCFEVSSKTCTEPPAGMMNSFGHASFMELSPVVHHAVSCFEVSHLWVLASW